MERRLLLGFAIITLIGLLLSIAVHFATFFGIDLQVRFPAVWLLHFGIFLTLIPLLIVYSKESGSRFGTIDHSLVMKHAPNWMKTLCMIFSIYTAVNFGLFFVLSEAGAPAIWDGHYILQNHGMFIRELTQSEYEKHLMYELRGFSGHWMIFYFYPFVAYYSYMHRQEDDDVTEQA